MKGLKPLALVFGGLVGLTIGSVGWAVGSTPVTVVNGANNPVQVAVQNPIEPGLTPFESHQFTMTCTHYVNARWECTGTLAVPAGKRLVIQSASVWWYVDKAPPAGVLSFVVQGNGDTRLVETHLTPTVLPINGYTAVAFDWNLAAAYSDPGDVKLTVAFPDGAQAGPTTVSVGSWALVAGYLIDCGVSVCAPIAP